MRLRNVATPMMVAERATEGMRSGPLEGGSIGLRGSGAFGNADCPGSDGSGDFDGLRGLRGLGDLSGRFDAGPADSDESGDPDGCCDEASPGSGDFGGSDGGKGCEGVCEFWSVKREKPPFPFYLRRIFDKNEDRRRFFSKSNFWVPSDACR
ncbi:MAG: hypothetical protein WA705_11300 [Candidatus Ozemobacteraceae bacterium]